MSRSVKGFFFGLEGVERLVWNWLEDAINIFENIVIDFGGKTVLEILVKYEKNCSGSVLVPKSAKKVFFILKRVGHTLNTSFKASWRTPLVFLKI